MPRRPRKSMRKKGKGIGNIAKQLTLGFQRKKISSILKRLSGSLKKKKYMSPMRKERGRGRGEKTPRRRKR